MAFERHLVTHPWDDYRCIPTLYDQHFGLGIDLKDFLEATTGLLRRGYHGPLRHGIPGEVSGMKEDKNTFKVLVDVQQFSPDEVQVKTVDNQLVVEGNHEEKKDEHGYISRQFVRRYQLPEGVQAEHVTSTLSSDGVLAITARKAVPEKNDNARHIPIKYTGGTPAVNAYPGKYGPHVLHGTLACHAAHHASHEHQGAHCHQDPRTHSFSEPQHPAVHAHPGKYGPHVLHGKCACHAAHHASHDHEDAHCHQDPLAHYYKEPQHPAVHASPGKYGPNVLHGTSACHAAHHASHEHQGSPCH